MSQAAPVSATAIKRVLIVDDSVVARAAIARVVDGSDRFAVAGAVATAAAAREFLGRTAVDLVLLDINMPGTSGLAALPDLLAAGGNARVLIVSSVASEGATATIEALSLGAADTLVKPAVGALAGRFAEALIDKLERLSQVDEIRPIPSALPSRPPVPTPLPLVPSSSDAFDVVAIGASTGGIHALAGLLRALPAEFRQPILITQHLPASFMPYFAAQIAVLARRPCDVAVDRMRIRPGRVIVAPGDAHLCCVSLSDGGAAIRLSTRPAGSGCLPSVDPMFDSVATVFGARALAVVLSGMGRDGAEGAVRVAETGGAIVIQDQASSVVWGMPGAIAAAGLAQATLAPEQIGELVASRRRPA